jgi:hypothetical protein
MCSTESLAEMFDETSFKQGFLNRPIFVVIKKAEWESATKKVSLTPEEVKLNEKIHCFLDIILKMGKKPKTEKQKLPCFTQAKAVSTLTRFLSASITTILRLSVKRSILLLTNGTFLFHSNRLLII